MRLLFRAMRAHDVLSTQIPARLQFPVETVMDNQNRLLGKARPHVDLRNEMKTFIYMPALLCRRLHSVGFHSRRTPLAVIHLHTWVLSTGGQSVSLQPILLQSTCCWCVYPESIPDDECCRFGGSFGVSKQSYLLKLTCLEVSQPLTRSNYVGPPARHSTTLQHNTAGTSEIGSDSSDDDIFNFTDLPTSMVVSITETADQQLLSMLRFGWVLYVRSVPGIRASACCSQLLP